MGIKKDREREHARILYVSERISKEEVAERTGVSVKTITRWANEDNWDKLRKSMLTTRQAQLVHWYNQLEAINEYIAERPDIIANGKSTPNPLQKNIPTNSEADTMSKITSNIQRLEVEINLGSIVEVSKDILVFVQSVDLSHAKLLKNYFDAFISDKLKNG